MDTGTKAVARPLARCGARADGKGLGEQPGDRTEDRLGRAAAPWLAYTPGGR
jgi:hypothetical protein